MDTATVTFCECRGQEHIVCKPGWKPAYIPDPWRQIAPWLADYSTPAQRSYSKPVPNKPNHKARRQAALTLGVTLTAPVVAEKSVAATPRVNSSAACACQGREHLVCLPERKWRAMLKVNGAYDRASVACPCRKHGEYVPDSAGSFTIWGKSVTYRKRLRRDHSRACRVLKIAERRIRWHDGAELPVKPSVTRRLLRLWLAVVRESWAVAPSVKPVQKPARRRAA